MILSNNLIMMYKKLHDAMLVGITHAVQVHMARYRGRVGHVERNNRKNHAVLVGNPTACTTSCKRRFEYPKQNRVFFFSLSFFVYFFGVFFRSSSSSPPLCFLLWTHRRNKK